MNATDLLAEYPVSITLPNQWGDMDAFGHVNNTVHIRWFESSRIAYLEQIGLSHMMTREGEGPKLGPILASITCNYRRQVDFPDTLTIGAKVSRIGNSSVSMQHAVMSEKLGEICADGDSVIVVFDYNTQRPVRVPDDIRMAIEALENHNLSK